MRVLLEQTLLSRATIMWPENVKIWSERVVRRTGQPTAGQRLGRGPAVRQQLSSSYYVVLRASFNRRSADYRMCITLHCAMLAGFPVYGSMQVRTPDPLLSESLLKQHPAEFPIPRPSRRPLLPLPPTGCIYGETSMGTGISVDLKTMGRVYLSYQLQL